MKRPASPETAGIRVAVVQMPKTSLDRISHEERQFFLLCGHVANEINVLNKLFYWASNFDESEEIITRAHMAQSLVIGKLLTGKLWEAWKIIQQRFVRSNLSDDYRPSLEDEAQTALKNLERYFANKDNVVRKVRNWFAFHYDWRKIAAGYNDDLKDDDLYFYIGENHANSMYYASEVVVNTGMLESLVPGNRQRAFDLLVSDTTAVAGWLLSFINGCMVVGMDRHFDGLPPFKEVTIKGAPDMDDVRIPYFVYCSTA